MLPYRVAYSQFRGVSGCKEAVLCLFEGPIRSLIHSPGAWKGGYTPLSP
jgi:hypothetical protein